MSLLDFIFGRSKEKERLQKEYEAEQERLRAENAKRVAEELEKRLAENRRKEEARKAMIESENSKKFQILDFYLDCSYCDKQEAKFEITSLALPVKRIDVENDEESRERYKVNKLPKLILVDMNGKEIHRWTGITEPSEINEYLYDNGYAERPVREERQEQITSLTFNGRDYKFPDSFLKRIFSCILENEKRDDEGILYVLSFVSNSIVQKKYEDLDYHEFILRPDYRASNLLCNIYNVFGQSKAKAYAEKLSAYLKEETSWATTNYIDSLEASEASKLGRYVFNASELEKFHILLAKLDLYSCAEEDYNQTVEDVKGFSDLLYINGIVVKRIEDNDRILLRPLNNRYDAPLSEYKNFDGVWVPPYVRAAVFKTEHNISFSEDDLIEEHSSLFFLKLEQVTGSRFDKKMKQKKSFGNKLDSSLYGKWYRVEKSDGHPVLPTMYHFMIDWYKEDGTKKRSMIFNSDSKIPSYENWANDDCIWRTKNGELLTVNEILNKETILKYIVAEEKLIIDGRKYYRSFDEALDNLE